MGDVTYRGFIRIPSLAQDGLSRWAGTNSDEDLLAANEEDAIMVSTTDDLVAELKKQFPDVDRDYGYIYDGYPTQPVWQYDEPCVRFSYVNGDRVAELARTHKTIKVVGALPGRYQYGDDYLTQQTSRDVVMVTYDPELAKKRRAKRELRSKLRLTSKNDVDVCRYGVARAISCFDKYAKFVMTNDGVSTLVESCSYLIGVLTIGISLIGIGKIREVPEVVAFLETWKKNEAENVKKYSAVSDASWSDKCGLKMIEMINRLLKRRPA